MTCPSTVVPRCYSDKRKSNVSDSVLFWISQAAICVTQFTVSVIKACAHFDFIWDGGKTQSFFFPPLSSDAVTDGEVCGASELVRPVFSLTHLGQWCMCTSWHEPAHTHTPVFTFSSQRGAKVPFPCVFRLCFELGEVILSPHGEIFSWSCKSSEDKSSYFVHSGDTCSIQFYCPLWQLLKHFMPHSGLCSLPTSCLWWRLFLPLPLYQIVFCPRFQRWIIKWFYCEICTGCRTEYFQIPPCMWFFWHILSCLSMHIYIYILYSSVWPRLPDNRRWNTTSKLYEKWAALPANQGHK